MKGLLERSREDVKLLHLKLALTLPLAGYLAANPNLSSSSSPARDESGAVGKSASHVYIGDNKSLKEEIHVRERASDSESVIHASTSGCKILKDEIHIQESEEALAKIFHGTSAIKEHFACTQLLLPTYETSLMRLIHSELDAKHVEKEQEIEERQSNHFLEYCLSEDQQALVREHEDQLKISIMQASNLSLKVQSMNQRSNQLRIQEAQYSGIISEIEYVRMIIQYLMKALKSDWSNSSQKLAVLEQEVALSDNKNDEQQKADKNVVANSKMLESKDECFTVRENILCLEQKNSEFAGERKDDTKVEADSKMPKELNDELMNLRENILSSELKNSEIVIEQKDDNEVETNSKTLMEVKDECINLVQMTEFVGMLDFEDNMFSFPCTPNGSREEELEATCDTQNEKEREIEQPPDDHHKAEFLEKLYDGQINSWSKYEKSTCDFCTQKSTESCSNGSLTAKTERKTEVVKRQTYMCIDQKNKYSIDIDTENCSSPQIYNESMSCSSDISSVTSNSSIVRSKNHSAHRTKVFSKLKKMVSGKHSNRKGKLFANKTPTESASSYTKQSFSTSCLEDLSSNSCHSDHSCSSQTTTTKHSVETGSDRWHTNSAWYQSFYRIPFDVSRGKVFAVQEEIHAFYQGNKGNPVISNG